jgi:hypothetical protein
MHLKANTELDVIKISCNTFYKEAGKHQETPRRTVCAVPSSGEHHDHFPHGYTNLHGTHIVLFFSTTSPWHLLPLAFSNLPGVK